MDTRLWEISVVCNHKRGIARSSIFTAREIPRAVQILRRREAIACSSLILHRKSKSSLLPQPSWFSSTGSKRKCMIDSNFKIKRCLWTVSHHFRSAFAEIHSKWTHPWMIDSGSKAFHHQPKPYPSQEKHDLAIRVHAVGQQSMHVHPWMCKRL